MNRRNCSKIAFVFGLALAGLLAGCVTHVHDQARVYAPAPLYAEHDDYVYYPGYQVYYSNNRRQYIYRDGRSWVSRPAPPRVSVDVLLSSPSVRLDFHDSPAVHHETVVRQYPKHWAPPGWSHDHKKRDRR